MLQIVLVITALAALAAPLGVVTRACASQNDCEKLLTSSADKVREAITTHDQLLALLDAEQVKALHHELSTAESDDFFNPDGQIRYLPSQVREVFGVLRNYIEDEFGTHTARAELRTALLASYERWLQVREERVQAQKKTSDTVRELRDARSFAATPAKVQRVQVSADGKRLAVSDSHLTHVYNIETMESLDGNVPMPPDSGPLRLLSPDLNFSLYSSGLFTTLERKLRFPFGEHEIGRSAFSTDGRHLFRSLPNERLLMRATETGKDLRIFTYPKVENFGHYIDNFDISPNGRHVLGFPSDPWRAFLWDVTRTSDEPVVQLEDKSKRSVIFSPDSETFLIEPQTFDMLEVRSSETGFLIREIPIPGSRPYFFLNDQEVLISQSSDGVARILNIETGKLGPVMMKESEPFAPDPELSRSRQMIARIEGGEIQLYRIRDQSLIGVLPLPGLKEAHSLGLIFALDDRYLIARVNDQVLRLDIRAFYENL